MRLVTTTVVKAKQPTKQIQSTSRSLAASSLVKRAPVTSTSSHLAFTLHPVRSNLTSGLSPSSSAEHLGLDLSGYGVPAVPVFEDNKC
jgi:hypothetical protein